MECRRLLVFVSLLLSSVCLVFVFRYHGGLLQELPQQRRVFHVGFIAYRQRKLRTIDMIGLRSWIVSALHGHLNIHVVCDKVSEITWKRVFKKLEPEIPPCVILTVKYYRFEPLIKQLAQLMSRAEPPNPSWTIEMLALAVFPLYLDPGIKFLFTGGVDEIMVKPLTYLDALFEELKRRKAAVMLPKDVVVNTPNSGLTLWNVELVQKLPWIDLMINATNAWGADPDQVGQLPELTSRFMPWMDMTMFYSLHKSAPALVLEAPMQHHVMGCVFNLDLYNHVSADDVFILHCCANTFEKVESFAKEGLAGPWSGLVKKARKFKEKLQKNLCS